MEKIKIRSEIASLIDSINEHKEIITSDERLAPLELELILSKMKRLYEKMIVLNYLFGKEQINSTAFYSSHNYDDSESDNLIKKELPPEKQQEEISQNDEALAVNTMEETNSSYNEVENSTVTEKTLSEPSQEVSVNTFLPVQEADNNLLYDILNKGKEDVDLVSKIKKKPVEVLLRAMGINERFLFTKELFNNNSEEFKNVVEKINNMSSLDQALDFIAQNIASQYNWNLKSQTVINFIKLVERRFL